MTAKTLQKKIDADIGLTPAQYWYIDKAIQELREQIIDLQINLEQTTKNDDVTKCMIYAYSVVLALIGEKK